MPAVTAAAAKSQHKGTQWGRVRAVAGAGGTLSDLSSAPTGELALLVNHNAAIAIKRPGAKARFAHPVMPVSSPTATYGHSMGANGVLSVVALTSNGVLLSQRPPGGSFSAPRLISSPSSTLPDNFSVPVVTDPGGNVTVFWVGSGAVYYSYDGGPAKTGPYVGGGGNARPWEHPIVADSNGEIYFWWWNPGSTFNNTEIRSVNPITGKVTVRGTLDLNEGTLFDASPDGRLVIADTTLGLRSKLPSAPDFGAVQFPIWPYFPDSTLTNRGGLVAGLMANGIIAAPISADGIVGSRVRLASASQFAFSSSINGGAGLATAGDPSGNSIVAWEQAKPGKRNAQGVLRFKGIYVKARVRLASGRLCRTETIHRLPGKVAHVMVRAGVDGKDRATVAWENNGKVQYASRPMKLRLCLRKHKRK